MSRRILLAKDIPSDFREFKPLTFKSEPKDPRDFPARAFTEATAIPSFVELPRVFPVRNQQAIGSCTGHSNALMLQYYELRRDGPAVELSPMFAYFLGRGEDRNIPVDTGAFNRSVLSGAQKFGISPERWWAYEGYSDKFRKTPDRLARLQACFHKAPIYVSVANLDELKASLAQGYPVVFNFPLFESVYRNAYIGDIPYPTDPNEGLRGFHSVLAVGYDDRTQTVRFINSWGEAFGDYGWGRLAYQYWEKDVYDQWAFRAR